MWLPPYRITPVAALQVGGGGGGSFTTLSPTDKHANVTLSGGNLTAVTTTNGWYGVRSVAIFGGGKWHIEVTLDGALDGSGLICGIMETASSNLTYPGSDANSLGFQIGNFFYHNGGFYDPDNPGSFSVGDVMIVEIDDDAGILYIAENTGSYVSANYPGAIATGAGNPKQFQLAMVTPGNGVTVNFGASAWVKTPTSGFVGLT